MRIHPLILSCLSLAMLSLGGCHKERDPITSQAELEDYQAALSKQVAAGELTEPEAIVALAEARKELKWGNKKRKRPASKKLEVLGNELKKQVSEGKLTTEEAAAKWTEAAKSAGKEKKPNHPSKQDGQNKEDK